jgi:chloride channel protein, CIC family
MPIVALGALLGALYGMILNAWIVDQSVDVPLCALLGMGCFLCAVVQSPLTSVLLIVEMTGNYNLALPLMAGCLFALWGATMLGLEPIYDAMLANDRMRQQKLSAQESGRAE